VQQTKRFSISTFYLSSLLLLVLRSPTFPEIDNPTSEAILTQQKATFGLQRFQPPEGFIVPQGPLPTLAWEHLDSIATLTPDPSITTRWFNDILEETTTADTPGRYLAYGEATGPDGASYRRALTCVVTEPGLDLTALARRRQATQAEIPGTDSEDGIAV
tara:strand:- start:41 stop:520 length:480 start_codon:yes stop_codon:yes gene_type:complete